MDVTIECPCAGTPHESDTVTLRDRLDFHTRTTIRKAMVEVETDDPKVRFAQRLAAVTEMYMLMGIERWTLVDARGKPEPVTHQAIRDLWEEVDTLAISDAAEELYNPVVLLPFSGPGIDVLAAYADGRIDISADGLADEAPEAIEAILDYHYPDGRHRDDFTVARWRLQLIAELGVGRLSRQADQAEAAGVERLRKVTHGR